MAIMVQYFLQVINLFLESIVKNLLVINTTLEQEGEEVVEEVLIIKELHYFIDKINYYYYSIQVHFNDNYWIMGYTVITNQDLNSPNILDIVDSLLNNCTSLNTIVANKVIIRHFNDNMMAIIIAINAIFY